MNERIYLPTPETKPPKLDDVSLLLVEALHPHVLVSELAFMGALATIDSLEKLTKE